MRNGRLTADAKAGCPGCFGHSDDPSLHTCVPHYPDFVRLPLVVEEDKPPRNLYIRIDSIESVCEQDGFCTVAVRDREHPYPIALPAIEVLALTATEVAVRSGELQSWMKNGSGGLSEHRCHRT